MDGGWRVFHGDMSMGGLITFFLLANQFFAPISVIGNQYNQALTAMAGAERVFRLIDVKPDWEDDPAATALPLVRGTGARVEFRGVTFGYNLASLGLQPGDVIRSVNGQAVTSEADLARVYQQSANADSVQAEVVRGGQTFPVQVPLKR